MKIVSISEDKKIEKRISITPEIAKKYISNGFEISLPKNYGEHLGFIDEDYKSQGVNIIEDEKKLIISHSNYYLELQELNLWIFYLHKQIWLVTKL